MLKLLTIYTLFFVTRRGSTDRFTGIAGCRTTKLDLVFVVDGSSRDFQQDFGYVRLWIQNITSYFDVSPYTTRVAIVQNGETPYTEFGFNAFDSTDEVLRAVNNIQFGAGTGSTGDTLRYVKDNIINTARNDASVMVLVLNDGQIQEREDVYWAARRFHDMGITTFAIGAGERVSNDLKIIASDPMEDHLFIVEDVRNIGTLERGIIKELCKHTVQECPTASHDLAFIIDGSSTIGYKNFEKIKKWMKNIVEAFDVGRDNTRVAVIQYSTYVQEEISLNDRLSKSEVLNRIDGLSLLIGDTHTGHALEYCMKTIFSESYGARNNIPDVVIVMTDGKAQDHEHVVHAAKLVHDAGIEVYAMGVGDHYSLEEIRDIASDPDENHVILANGFDQIDLQRVGLIKRICVESEPGCPNTAAEIVFLVDNQMTIDEDNFHNVKTLLKNTVDSLEVGPHYSRISVVRYAAVSEVLFDLSTHTTTSQVINAISRQFQFKNGNPNEPSSTGRAIDYVKSVVFGHVRKNVPKFLIIITNGYSRDNFVPAVKRSQKMGIEIFSVGVGDVQSNNLRRLANVPEHVFRAETFDGIRRKRGDFIAALCAVSEPTCSVQEIDLQFLVDGSSRMTTDDFEKVKRWIRNVIRSFDIGSYTTRVGLTQYSSSIRNEFDMNTYKTRREIEHAVEIIQLMGGNSNTGSALEYVRERSFTESSGSRNGASKVLVVISDGNSEESITGSAKKIHDKGIRVFAVGAGSNTERDFLDTLATEPIVTHVTESSSYDAINTVRQQIVDEICRETKSECPEAEMDLIFLLDGSITADPECFQLVKEWLISFVNQFEIGEHNSKIGLIQYADQPRLEINLRNVSDKETLTDAIVSIEPIVGKGFTGAALQYVREQGFSDKSSKRKNTPKVVIVLTNGESLDPISAPAQLLRDDGVIMYSVGVGNTDRNELRSIASSEDNVLHVRNYDAIPTIHSSLVRRVCQEVQTECPENATDIVLLIDGSYSVGYEDWKTVKSFMRNITEKFNIGPDGVQVGVVQYASQPRIEFNLNDFADRSSLHQAIRNIDWMRGDAHLGEALRFTRQHALTAEAGVRGSYATKLLIIVTDGDPQDSDEAKAAASAIRSDGWRVFAIGVGQATLPELHILASEPGDEHVFHADNFESTRNLKGRLFRMICTAYDTDLFSEKDRLVQPALAEVVPDIDFDIFSESDDFSKDRGSNKISVDADQRNDVLGDGENTLELQKPEVFDANRDNETGEIVITSADSGEYAIDVKKHKNGKKQPKSKKNDKVRSRSPPIIAGNLIDEVCPKLVREDGKITKGWDYLEEMGIIRQKKPQQKISIKPKRSTLLTRFVGTHDRLKSVRTKPGSSENQTSFRISSKVELFGPLEPRMSYFFDDSWHIIATFRMQGSTTDMLWTLINITNEVENSVFSIALNGKNKTLTLGINMADDVRYIEVKSSEVEKLFDRNFHKIEIIAKKSKVAVKVDCVIVTKSFFEPSTAIPLLLLGSLVTSSNHVSEHVIVDVQNIVFECEYSRKLQCCELSDGLCTKEDNEHKNEGSPSNIGDGKDGRPSGIDESDSGTNDEDKNDSRTNEGDENDSRTHRGDENDSRTNGEDENDSRTNRGDENDSRTRIGDENDSRTNRGDENNTRTNRGYENDSRTDGGGENDSRKNEEDVNDDGIDEGHENGNRTDGGGENDGRTNEGDENDSRKNGEDVNDDGINRGDENGSRTNEGDEENSRTHGSDENDNRSNGEDGEDGKDNPTNGLDGQYSHSHEKDIPQDERYGNDSRFDDIDVSPTTKSVEKCFCPPGPRGPPGLPGKSIKRRDFEKPGLCGPAGISASQAPPLTKSTVRHIAKKVATSVIENEIRKMYKVILNSITDDGRIDPIFIKSVISSSRYDKKLDVSSNREILKKSAHKHRKPDIYSNIDEIPEDT